MGSKLNKKIGFVVIKEDILDTSFLDTVKLKELFNHVEIPNQGEVRHEMTLSDQKDNCLSCFINIIDYTDSKKIYLITPPSLVDEWTRRNNFVDMLEANGSSDVKIQYINTRVLPYWNDLIVSSTGEDLDSTQEGRLSLNAEYFNKFSPNVKEDLEAKGIDFSKNLKEQAHMKAPQIVLELAKQIGVTELKDLKLAIVSFWD